MRYILPLLAFVAFSATASAQWPGGNADGEDTAAMTFEVEPYCWVNVIPDDAFGGATVTVNPNTGDVTVSAPATLHYATNYVDGVPAGATGGADGDDAGCEISLSADHTYDFDQVSLLVDFVSVSNVLTAATGDNGSATDAMFDDSDSSDKIVVKGFDQFIGNRGISYDATFTPVAAAGSHTITLVYTASAM